MHARPISKVLAHSCNDYSGMNNVSYDCHPVHQKCCIVYGQLQGMHSILNTIIS